MCASGAAGGSQGDVLAVLAVLIRVGRAVLRMPCSSVRVQVGLGGFAYVCVNSCWLAWACVGLRRFEWFMLICRVWC